MPPRATLLPVLVPLAIAGCGGTQIDHSKVENLLIGKAPAGGATVKSADCPSGIDAKAGKSFDCKVKMSDGTSGTWTVNVVDSKGEVTASGADFSSSAPARKGGPTEVGKTKDVPAGHGIKLRVTLLAYKPNAGPVNDDAMAHVSTVTLRIVNPSSKSYTSDPLSAITILHDTAGAGASTDDSKTNGSQPCSRSFWAQKLKLAPGASVKGCIPYHVGDNEDVVDFNLGPGGGAGVTWKLG